MDTITDIINKYYLKVGEFNIINKTIHIKNVTIGLYNRVNSKITIKKINEIFVLLVMVIGLEKTVRLLLFIICTMYRTLVLFIKMTTQKNIQNIQNIDFIENRIYESINKTNCIKQSLDMIIYKQNKTEELLTDINKNLSQDINNINKNFNIIIERIGENGTDKYTFLQHTDLVNLSGSIYDIHDKIPIAYNQ